MRGTASPRRGRALADIGLIKDAAVLIAGGRIVAADAQAKVLRHPWVRKNFRKLRELDCRGKTVTPGFVDSHTHPVFVAPRLVDFEKRIAGATYQQIASAGGGIRSSVSGVRGASRAALADATLRALSTMLANGTTTVEAKSGYGLTVRSEIKSLEALRMAARLWPGEVAPTLLAAHVVPAEFKGRAGEYVELICEEIIPVVARRTLAWSVDVYCERGAFTLAQTRTIFASALQHGLGVRAHVGQFSPCALKGLFQDSPASLDHMDHIRADDIRLLAKSPTVATLVPASNFFLGSARYPDARQLISKGAAIALATDYNPGTAPTPSMPFVLSLACTQMKMSPAEALSAATINGAHALGMAARKGGVERGKDADLAIFDAADYREICYWIGVNLCSQVIVNGAVHPNGAGTERSLDQDR